MKLTVVLLIATCLQVSAKSFSQKVTLKERNIPLQKVFEAIRKQTGYQFFYADEVLFTAKNVTIDVKKASVETALGICFKNQELDYSISENTIIVKREIIIPAASVPPPAPALIKGNVIDDKGQPLVGATVLVKGTGGGTKTDAAGNFFIEVPENAVLVFSYLGYITREISVATSNVITVTLKPTDQQLEQIVVVGYGTQKKKDITGAIATLSAKDLENRPNTQFGNSIEGKAAGVQVIRSSGQPQAGFSIRVRGTSSITSSSDPLYIVDGVQTYNTNEINPADIESISILKDASSAAIYGTGGANGVVLITTKRGKNQKLRLSFNTSLTQSKAWKKMEVLNESEFKELATAMGATTDWNKYNANTNWQDETFRKALTQNYQLAATGGNAKTTYYVSGSIINQNGIVLNNNLKRGTFKVNLDHQLTKIFKIGTAIAYDNWKDRDVSENNRNGVITRLYTTIPNIGTRNVDYPAQYERSPFVNDLENPVSTVYQPDHQYKNSRYHGNVYAEAEVLKGLKFKSLFGFEKSDGKFNSFQDSVQTRYGKSQGGIAMENTYQYNYWVSENTANYNTKIKEHTISALAGFIVSRETSDNLYKSSHDFEGAKDDNVASGNIKSPHIPDFAQRSHVSFIGRINYAYKDKYYVTSNFRADGSGQFSSKYRWGYFPSFSSGWRISQENFFKKIKGVNELKLRAGWGLVGNDRSRPYAWYGLVDTLSKYLIGGNTRTAFIPTTLENVDLKWEKTSQIDIGLDLAVLNNRLFFTADYYYKKTNDLLLEVPQPTSTGFSTALQNAGSIENSGFEFQVISKNSINTNFKWSTDFNISFNRNKVLSIVGNTIHSGGINPAGDDFNTAIVQEGKPLGSFFGKISEGVDPASGNINFMQNAAGSGDSLGIVGNANPKYVFGLTNTFRYKNFTLDIFLQGVQGNQVINATRILTESMALVMNQSASVLRRWKKPGDITDIPGVTPADWTNSNPSTRYLENGSYIRVKALTLGYNLPQSVLTKLKMSRCMFYFTGENLFTFTKYSGFDPEVSAFSGNNQSAKNQNTASGVDFGTYPQSRDLIVGVNISF